MKSPNSLDSTSCFGGEPWFDVVVSLIHIIIVATYCRKDIDVLAPLLKRSGLDGRGWVTAIGVFVALALFMSAYFAGFQWLGLETDRFLPRFREHGWPLWTAFVLISLEPGILEELAFRGQMMARLERVLSPTDAVVVQAAMFSVIHMSPLIFISHFVFGLALGWLRRKSRSLYPGMLVHGAWNALVLIMESHL